MIKKSAEIKIISNANKIEDDLESLEDRIKKLVDAQDRLKASGKEKSEVYDNIGKKIEELNSKYESQRKSLDKIHSSNRNVFKSTLDNGGAMGLLNDATGGLAMTVKDAVEATDLFGGSLKGMKAALIGTGIGALVVALGLIAVYWEDIKGFISGASREQERLTKATKEAAIAAQDKLTALEESDNVLKLQGKTEKEILQLKINQTKEVIAKSKLELDDLKARKQKEIEIAKGQRDLLLGLMEFVRKPVRLVENSILAIMQMASNAMGGALDGVIGKMKTIQTASEVANKMLVTTTASWLGIGDVEDTEKEFAEQEKVITDNLKKLENRQAGYQLNVNAINKEAHQKALDEKKISDEAYLALQKKLNTDLDNLRADDAQKKLNLEKQRELDAINQLKDKNETEKELLRKLLDDKYVLLQNALNKELAEKKRVDDEKAAADKLAKAKELQDLMDANVKEKEYKDAKTTADIEKIRLDREADLNDERAAKMLKAQELDATDAQIEAIRQAFITKQLENDKAAVNAKTDLEKKKYDVVKSYAQQGLNMTNALEQTGLLKSKAAQKITKALTLAQIGADTASAISSLVKGSESTGAAAGPAYLPVKIATFAAGILPILANIAKAKQLLGGGGGGADASVSAGAATIAKPSVSFQDSPQSQISDTIRQSTSSQPVIKTYVKLEDIRDAEAFDRSGTNRF